MINSLDLSEEELLTLDENTRKAIQEGRICPIKINIDLILGDKLHLPNRSVEE